MKAQYTHMVRCVLYDRGEEYTTVYEIARIGGCESKRVHSAISCLRINGEIEWRMSRTFCKANHRPVQEFRLRDRTTDPRASDRVPYSSVLAQVWTGVRNAGA